MEKIRQGISTLKPSEQKVAQYIIENYEKVLTMPIAKLAKECNTSEPTIIRMCRSLQFKGFRDLKLSISASVYNKKFEIDRYKDLSTKLSILEITNFVSHNNLLSIEDTLSVLDVREVEKAVNLLNHSRRILAIGVGASAIVALDFEQKCKRINRWCDALWDSHSQLTSAVHLTANDTVLAISYSGETKEIMDTIKIAKQNNAKIISLTSFGNNSIQKMADINLFASSQEESIRSSATASRIAQLNIIDILYTGLASMNYEQSVEYLDRTREAIDTIFQK